MALKQFVIPLDDKSIQSGDITFEKLTENADDVTFQLTNVAAGSIEQQLNLITSKNGSKSSHVFMVTVSGGKAKTVLTPTQMKIVYDDAKGGDWDYVESDWTLGDVDIPDKSNQNELQSGHTYDTHDWPPKIH